MAIRDAESISTMGENFKLLTTCVCVPSSVHAIERTTRTAPHVAYEGLAAGQF
jgi:hypothetical protein